MKTSNGQPVTIVVLQHNPEGATVPAAGAVPRRVALYIDESMVTQLEMAGYRTGYIRDRAMFQPGPGRYLLTMRVSSYKPGSMGARRTARIVGAGLVNLITGAVGSADVELHYALSAASGAALAQGDIKGASGSDKPEVGLDRAVASTLEAVTSTLRGGR